MKMRLTGTVLIGLAFAHTVHARSIEEVNEPLLKEQLRKDFCKLTANHIGEHLSFNLSDCEAEGRLKVTQKIYDTLRTEENEEKVLTALNVSYTDENQDLRCSGLAILNLAHNLVDNTGRITRVPRKWKIPEVNCDSSLNDALEVLEFAHAGDENVKAIRQNQLPAPVKESMDHTDLAFEEGDGYYDILKETYYKVLDPEDSSKIIGYLLVAKMSYTEEEGDYYATARFTASGKRINPPEGLD